MPRDDRFQFTLTQLFVLTAIVALICGIGRLTGSPALVIQLSAIFLGWGMRRFAHAPLGALIPSLLGVDILACEGISWAYYGFDDPEFVRNAIAGFATLLVIVGLGVFLLAAWLNRPYPRRQAGLAIFFLIVLVAWWAVVPAIGNTTVAERKTMETAANNAAMATAVAQIESLRERLGRVPEESEVNDLLDQPLPYIRIRGFATQIRYQRTADDAYQLRFCYWDIFLYDSTTPARGRYHIPF